MNKFTVGDRVRVISYGHPSYSGRTGVVERVGNLFYDVWLDPLGGNIRCHPFELEPVIPSPPAANAPAVPPPQLIPFAGLASIPPVEIHDSLSYNYIVDNANWGSGIVAKGPACDCGGRTCNTTCSTWCSAYKTEVA